MFKAIMLLAVAGSLQSPMLEKCGDLAPRGNTSYTLSQVKKDQHITVRVQGTNQGGELNCYLLAHNPKGQGWTVAVKYEGAGNACFFDYTSEVDQPMKLWLQNNSKVATGYEAQVY